MRDFFTERHDDKKNCRVLAGIMSDDLVQWLLQISYRKLMNIKMFSTYFCFLTIVWQWLNTIFDVIILGTTFFHIYLLSGTLKIEWKILREPNNIKKNCH